MSLTIPVAPAALAVSTTVLPDAAAGSPHSAALATSGGTPPYMWSTITGDRPSLLPILPDIEQPA